MKISNLRSCVIWVALTWGLLASAQTTPNNQNYIVAVVDSIPITNHDVTARVLQLQQELKQQQRPLPEGDALLKDALERLIVEKALLQYAKETNITVEPEAIDQAEERVAAQNLLTVEAMRNRLKSEGSSIELVRQNLKDQILLQRLIERNVPGRIKISDAEIDQAIRQQEDSNIDKNPDIELGHVLIEVPEKASPSDIAKLQAKAETALAKLRRGDDLASVANEFSNGAERDQGGLMGLRSANRYPTLFVEAVKPLRVGDVTLVRSGAGFHVLKLVTKQPSRVLTITQTHSRHILLRPSGQLSQTAARAKLTEYKRQIESGKADFAQLAQEHSQDASGPEGGDLGWVSSGMFVPEFEEVMNKLSPGQIADPTVSRFGVHLIQVLERREVPITERELRDIARNNLREKKFDEVYQTWAQDIRNRAFVEYRDAPQ